jgi:hypothetical protein
VSYRDELDAAHARIAALETDLARTQRELTEAKGGALVKVSGGDQALVRGNAGGQAAPRWLGAPAQLRFERELDGECPADAHTEMIELMRRAFGVAGTTTVLPGSLAWSIAGGQNNLTPTVNIYVTARRGKTKLTLEQRLGQTIGAIYGGVGGGVGGGGGAVGGVGGGGGGGPAGVGGAPIRERDQRGAVVSRQVLAAQPDTIGRRHVAALQRLGDRHRAAPSECAGDPLVIPARAPRAQIGRGDRGEIRLRHDGHDTASISHATCCSRAAA